MAHKHGSFYGRKAPKRARKVRTFGENTPGAPRFYSGSIATAASPAEVLKSVTRKRDLRTRQPSRPVTVRQGVNLPALPVTVVRKRANDRMNYGAFLLKVSPKDPR